MTQKFTVLLIAFQLMSIMALTQTLLTDELTADYGPPAEANTWEKFVIPLNAESFNTDEATFAAAMENITSFWIRTEMHTGDDVGGIDEVLVGETYSSYFDNSSELWSSGGDGTMQWMSSDGVNGGFLQISDWSTGDWHWLIAPANWAGDWSSLIGQNIEFWFKTDRPSYSAIIMLTTEPVYRLSINTPASSTVPLNDSILVEVEITPPPTEEMTIYITSFEKYCIDVPSSVVVPAGHSTVNVYALSAFDATIGCESVVEVTASGYLTSRITIKVEGYSGIRDPVTSQVIMVNPNPSNGKFMISNKSGKSIQRIIMYDIHANVVVDLQGKDIGNSEIIANDQAAGLYFVKIFLQDQVLTSKVIIE